MSEWWLSTDRMTIWVLEDGGIIEDAAPIVRRFTGQHISNLRAWLRKQGGFKEKQLDGR
jgi:hypothetical protein